MEKTEGSIRRRSMREKAQRQNQTGLLFKFTAPSSPLCSLRLSKAQGARVTSRLFRGPCNANKSRPVTCSVAPFEGQASSVRKKKARRALFSMSHLKGGQCPEVCVGIGGGVDRRSIMEVLAEIIQKLKRKTSIGKQTVCSFGLSEGSRRCLKTNLADLAHLHTDELRDTKTLDFSTNDLKP
ncbi:hypothetical protein DNTS_001891 [Danionella cerebrum]|uniref:Uncharacterized protein n=1 Tax=Danionella cerebrum TaxID=2873325 RepID=A0A553PVU5_9TELE|nr:hypothetical protein DNTS_001891 [Danionella translucida]